MFRYRSDLNSVWRWNFFSAASHGSASVDRGILEAQGFVEDAISSKVEGRIRLHGVYWLARLENSCQQSLEVGTAVTVLRREGLTLVVQPDQNVKQY